jgi:hypothetical protein
MHWNDDSEGWLGERVAARPRLLLAAEAEANVGCRRGPEQRSRQQRVLVGRVSEQVAVAKNQRKKAVNAEAELLRLVAGVFRN